MSKQPDSVLHVLMFIFKKYMNQAGETTLSEDNLMSDLTDAGFEKKQVYYALDWLKGLATQKDDTVLDSQHLKTSAMRIYNPHEQHNLDLECRGLLYHLEQAKILNPRTREIVIDRLLALKTEGIDPSLVKWVSLMVLFNQGDEQEALSFMEYITLNDTGCGLH